MTINYFVLYTCTFDEEASWIRCSSFKCLQARQSCLPFFNHGTSFLPYLQRLPVYVTLRAEKVKRNAVNIIIYYYYYIELNLWFISKLFAHAQPPYKYSARTIPSCTFCQESPTEEFSQRKKGSLTTLKTSS